MPRVKRKKTSGPSLDDEYSIWEFVYENLCRTQLYTDADEPMFRQYLKENPDKKWSITELMDYFNNSMLGSLYKCDLPEETVLGLYKTLCIEISAHVEQMLELKCRATLRIDSDRCLHSYTLFSMASRPEERAPVVAVAPEALRAPSAFPAQPDTPEEERRRKQPISSIPHDMRVSEKFERRMWRYVFNNYDRLSMAVLLSAEFWEELINCQQDMPLQSAKMMMHYFRCHMLPKVYMQQAEVEKRIGIYQLMECQMSQEAKEWFREKDRAWVVLDFHGYVVRWEKEQERNPMLSNIATWQPRSGAPNAPSSSNSAPAPSVDRRAHQAQRLDSEDSEDEMVVPKRSPPPSSYYRAESELGLYAKKKRVFFTDEDRLMVWKYIYKEIKKSIEFGTEPVLLKGITFWNSYVRKTNSSKTAVNWSSHFRKKMWPTLYEMKLPRKHILFLYKNIGIEISDHVKHILERKCQVKLDINERSRQLIGWRSSMNKEEEDQEKEENPEDCDSTIPMVSDDDELNQAMDGTSAESDEEEEEPEISALRNTTPKKQPTSSRTSRTFRTPRAPRTPSPTLEAVTSRISISGASGRSARGRSSLRGTPIAPMPFLEDLDWEHDRQPEEDLRATPKKRRSEVANNAKTPKTPKTTPELDSPSKRTLRPRPEPSSAKKRTPFKKPETPRTSSNKKKEPADSLDDVPESQASCDMFLMSQPTGDPESGHREEEEKQKEEAQENSTELLDSEYMSQQDLLEMIEEAMKEIDDDDGASDAVRAAVEMAFRKENWDESGTLESSLFNTIMTIIESNTRRAHQDTLMKNIDGLVKNLLTHVENRLVYDQRVAIFGQLLENELKKKTPGPSGSRN